MRSKVTRAELLEEFIDLDSQSENLEKEVFAHFGLAFMKFGLLEHSLVNVVVFSSAAEALSKRLIKTKEQWGQKIDDGFAEATAMTFGNLVKRALQVSDFSDLRAELMEAKKLWDYFAHHFMREEAGRLGSSEGCWLLLLKIAEVRRTTISIEELAKTRFAKMCSRLRIPTMSDEYVDREVQRLRRKAFQAIVEGNSKVGWEK